MPPSTEFISLCHAQITLLIQCFRVSLCAVYLTEEWSGEVEAQLIPVAVYPDDWQTTPAALPHASEIVPPSNPETHPRSPHLPLSGAPQLTSPSTFRGGFAYREISFSPQPQVVMPLTYEGLVLGALVVRREHRSWRREERNQLESIAQTLAIACWLDQRNAWFVQQYDQQQQVLAEQRDAVDTLMHQFRNPLTALRTFGKLLLKRFLVGDPNRDVAQSIVRESDRLQELAQQLETAVHGTVVPTLPPPALPGTQIGNLTPLSQPVTTVEHPSETTRTYPPSLPPSNESWRLLLPAGQSEKSRIVPCSLTDILQPLLVSAAAIAEDRDQVLLLSGLGEIPTIQANAIALGEVLSNLLDNALKYTPIGGTIAVDLTISQGETSLTVENFLAPLPNPLHPQAGVILAISDTGPGIPPQDLDHLFERHYRGVQAQTDIPGTGLGLGIARDLLTRMGGTIQVFSPRLKQLPSTAIGTTVVVGLPVA